MWGFCMCMSAAVGLLPVCILIVLIFWNAEKCVIFAFTCFYSLSVNIMYLYWKCSQIINVNWICSYVLVTFFHSICIWKFLWSQSDGFCYKYTYQIENNFSKFNHVSGKTCHILVYSKFGNTCWKLMVDYSDL